MTGAGPLAIPDSFLKIVNRIMDASHLLSDQAPANTLDVLREFLPIRACSFYSYNWDAESLSLRAQYGFDYDKYQSFTLGIKSTAGRAIEAGEVVVEYDLVKAADFRDTKLIKSAGLTTGVFVPLRVDKVNTNAIDPQKVQKLVGVVCLYPTLASDTPTIIEHANALMSLLGTLYGYSVDNDKLSVRRNLVDRCLGSRALSGFLTNVTKLLKDQWRIEAASLFLWDERSDVLRLQATTGLIGNYRKAQVLYRLDEDSRTIKAFKDKIPVNLIRPDRQAKGKFVEQVAGTRESALLVPILEPPAPGVAERRSLGVLRLVNRLIHRECRTEPVAFGWEDILFAEFVAEFVGIVCFIYAKSAGSAEDAERAVHGVSRNLFGLQTKLEQLKERGQLESRLDPRLRYIVPNATAQLEAITWQIDRALGREGRSIERQPINLWGDVLAKITPSIKPIAEVLNAPPPRMPFYDYDSFVNSPVVFGDADALITVFRNLIENALKYAKPNAEYTEINLRWLQADQEIWVFVADNGIGVSKVEQPYLFREGFQGEDAMRRCPSGSGIGLHQCKTIMQQLDGDVDLYPAGEYRTTFVVKIPTWGIGK